MRIHTRTERDKFNHVLKRLDPKLSNDLRTGFSHINCFGEVKEDLEYVGEWEDFIKTEEGQECLTQERKALTYHAKLLQLLKFECPDVIYLDTMLGLIKCSRECHLLATTKWMELQTKHQAWVDSLSEAEFEEFENRPPQEKPLYVPPRMKLALEPDANGEMVKVLKHRHSIHDPF